MEPKPQETSSSALAPKESLDGVRGTFGTLIVESASVVLHQGNYRGCGPRILILTEARGIRDPNTAGSNDVDDKEFAPIDLALTPEIAKKVHRLLGQALENYEEVK